MVLWTFRVMGRQAQSHSEFPNSFEVVVHVPPPLPDPCQGEAVSNTFNEPGKKGPP